MGKKDWKSTVVGKVIDLLKNPPLDVESIKTTRVNSKEFANSFNIKCGTIKVNSDYFDKDCYLVRWEYLKYGENCKHSPEKYKGVRISLFISRESSGCEKHIITVKDNMDDIIHPNYFAIDVLPGEIEYKLLEKLVTHRLDLKKINDEKEANEKLKLKEKENKRIFERVVGILGI